VAEPGALLPGPVAPGVVAAGAMLTAGELLTDGLGVALAAEAVAAAPVVLADGLGDGRAGAAVPTAPPPKVVPCLACPGPRRISACPRPFHHGDHDGAADERSGDDRGQASPAPAWSRAARAPGRGRRSGAIPGDRIGLANRGVLVGAATGGPGPGWSRPGRRPGPWIGGYPARPTTSTSPRPGCRSPSRRWYRRRRSGCPGPRPAPSRW